MLEDIVDRRRLPEIAHETAGPHCWAGLGVVEHRVVG
jgi:hypothetical protein